MARAEGQALRRLGRGLRDLAIGAWMLIGLVGLLFWTLQLAWNDDWLPEDDDEDTDTMIAVRDTNANGAAA